MKHVPHVRAVSPKVFCSVVAIAWSLAACSSTTSSPGQSSSGTTPTSAASCGDACAHATQICAQITAAECNSQCGGLSAAQVNCLASAQDCAAAANCGRSGSSSGTSGTGGSSGTSGTGGSSGMAGDTGKVGDSCPCAKTTASGYPPNECHNTGAGSGCASGLDCVGSPSGYSDPAVCRTPCKAPADCTGGMSCETTSINGGIIGSWCK